MRERTLGRKIWGIITPMLIYLCVQVAVILIIQVGITLYGYFYGMPLSKLNQYLTEITNNYAMLLTGISALGTIPIMGLLIKLDIDADKRIGDFKRYESVAKWKYLLILPFGAFCMWWASMLVSILQMFMPQFMIDSYSSTQTAIYSSSFISQLITAGFIAPIVEEMIFRGLIYKRLKVLSNVTIAAILSAVLFGVFHGNWIQAPYTIIIGLLAVWLYEKYKSIVAPILFHMEANITSVLVSAMSEAASTGSDTTETISNSELIYGLFTMMIVFALASLIIGAIINKLVKPKEV